MREFITKHGQTLTVKRTDKNIQIYLEGKTSPIFDANIANTDVADVEKRACLALRRYGVESAQYP